MSDDTVWFVINPETASHEAFWERRDAEERAVELAKIMSVDGDVHIRSMNERFPVTYVTYGSGCVTAQQFEVQ